MLEPLPPSEWNEANAAHLLNRAGFGATLDQIESAARRKPADVVEELVEYEAIPDPAVPPDWIQDGMARRAERRPRRVKDPEGQEEARKARMKDERDEILSLRAWWLNRMLHSPRPLEEKLTLFWHGHFATAFKKVKSATAMYLQNQTFREHACGPWEEILTAVAQDPAMLVYLDNAQSRAEAPNENFARELLELFTLGEGHYSESDIQAAARAFTGWSIDRDRMAFVFRPRQHDPGMKTFLGEKGTHEGEDVLHILSRHPRSATFILEKLWRFFASPAPEPALVAELARQLVQSRFQFRPVLKTIFLSRAFYSPQAVRTQIKSPVQYLVSALRSLDAELPKSRRGVDRALRLLGQELFDPPNVRGWIGGFSWISTGSLTQRYRLADALVKGLISEGIALGLDSRVDPDRILPVEARQSRFACRRYLQWKLYQSELRPQDEDYFDAYLAQRPPPARWSDETVKDVVSYMMKTPQYQLT